jgi:hypothetical protein
MKIKSDKWQVTSDTNRQPVRNESVFSCHPSPVTRHHHRGVALVLTLILLSVALVMVLAFLAISGRERGSVTTQTDAAAARLAAEAGLAAAEAQIAANILSTTNPYSFGLLVSTNYPPFAYTNPADFANLFISPRAPVWLSNTVTHATENRFYLDLNRNGRDDPNGWVTNVDNNGNLLGTSFQIGDPEWIGVLARPDMPYGPDNPFIARFAFIALPVGNSLDLNAIHNQTLMPALSYNPVNPANDGYFRNQGVGTWEINLPAFLADLNTNEWDNNSGNTYQYRRPLGFANSGAAFNDAFSLIAYRYAGNYNTLAPVGGNSPPGLFTTGNIFPPFQNNIDAYSMGPLQTTPAGINVSGQSVLLPWAGADNTNHSFTPGELFDPAKSSAGFTSRLLNAGTTNSTYDRNTFYRMLSQLGTDTTPESGKMNLNYDNLDPGSNGVLVAVGGTTSSTNFVPWTPLNFFTNAADRLLKAYTAKWATTYIYDINGVLVPLNNPAFVATFNTPNAFGVTSIPVLVSNQFVYTPAVNRLLQLAANMYDATTTGNYPGISPEGQFVKVANGANYPAVFRPIFTVVPENGYNDVYITGYTNQNPFIDHDNQMGEIAPPVEVTTLPLGSNILANVYGVPWIIGAKKGLPNFNAFSVESAFQMVRKLEVMRDTNAVPQPDITWTNQMYLMNITNYMALSCWNSYLYNYPGPVDILVRCGSTMTLTNDDNMAPYLFTTNYNFAVETPLIAPNWPGWDGVPRQQSSSFFVPLSASVMTLTNAIYYYGGVPNSKLLPAGDSPSNYLDKGVQPLPHFGMLMTNRLQVAIIDYSTNVSPANASGPVVGRIVDYVQLGGMDSSQDLNAEILDPQNNPYHFWDSGQDANGNLLGVFNQLLVSMYGVNIYGQGPTGNAGWTTGQIPGGPTGDTTPAAQQAFFRGFFAKDGSYSYNGIPGYVNSLSVMQAPYTPMVFGIQHTTWAANDPLVHYLASDLAPHTEHPQNVDFDPNNLRVTTDRYQPWGAAPSQYDTGIDQNSANLAFKDPLVRGSDNWDFPANKLPTVGWLGRVHRGTPWQTVYLKSTNILNWANNVGQNGLNTWINRTGDGNFFDAINASPVEDRLLFDLFTTAFNDNATRGQLSVNVGSNSLAAWSAVFSGIVVLTNNASDQIVKLVKPWPPFYAATNIQPAGPYNPALPLAQQPALGQIVAGIDQTRATFTNADGLVGAFEHKGDILATPQLTEQAPFLNWNNAAQRTNGISDEMYEWLPQQAMSLLRVGTPRYVIYSYGQALKPAPLPNGVFVGGSLLVTNYQVVSEMATRAVVRLETMRTNAIGANNSNGTNGTILVTPPRAVIESFNILPPD